MSYGDPELFANPCPACGCPDVFTASAAARHPRNATLSRLLPLRPGT